MTRKLFSNLSGFCRRGGDRHFRAYLSARTTFAIIRAWICSFMLAVQLVGYMRDAGRSAAASLVVGPVVLFLSSLWSAPNIGDA